MLGYFRLRLHYQNCVRVCEEAERTNEPIAIQSWLGDQTISLFSIFLTPTVTICFDLYYDVSTPPPPPPPKKNGGYCPAKAEWVETGINIYTLADEVYYCLKVFPLFFISSFQM